MIKSGYNDLSKYKCWTLFRATLICIWNRIFETEKILDFERRKNNSDVYIFAKNVRQVFQFFACDGREITHKWQFEVSNTCSVFPSSRSVVFGYTGETSRHFATRVKEHLSTDKNSHVYKHLNGSPSCKRKCSVDCFKIVDSAKTRHCLKVIPLKLFYYQTFFETWPG